MFIGYNLCVVSRTWRYQICTAVTNFDLQSLISVESLKSFGESTCDFRRENVTESSTRKLKFSILNFDSISL